MIGFAQQEWKRRDWHTWWCLSQEMDARGLPAYAAARPTAWQYHRLPPNIVLDAVSTARSPCTRCLFAFTRELPVACICTAWGQRPHAEPSLGPVTCAGQPSSLQGGPLNQTLSTRAALYDDETKGTRSVQRGHSAPTTDVMG